MLSHLGNDPEGERIASDSRKMLAEQVSGSLSVTGGSGTHDLDMVAFPVHLTSSVTLARGSGNRIEVGTGELERRVGFDSAAQLDGRSVTVVGSLRPTV